MTRTKDYRHGYQGSRRQAVDAWDRLEWAEDLYCFRWVLTELPQSTLWQQEGRQDSHRTSASPANGHIPGPWPHMVRECSGRDLGAGGTANNSFAYDVLGLQGGKHVHPVLSHSSL